MGFGICPNAHDQDNYEALQNWWMVRMDRTRDMTDLVFAVHWEKAGVFRLFVHRDAGLIGDARIANEARAALIPGRPATLILEHLDPATEELGRRLADPSNSVTRGGDQLQ